MLEQTLESPLDCKETQPVHPKGNQSWTFIDGEAETPILWLPDAKNWLIWKDPNAGKDWSRRRRGQQRIRWLMASPTWWTWFWVSSGSWWWTGRPDVLWFMGSQRVRHNWATELNWSELNWMFMHILSQSWNSPGQNTGWAAIPFSTIFPTQGLNPGLPHCRQILYQWATGKALVNLS